MRDTCFLVQIQAFVNVKFKMEILILQIPQFLDSACGRYGSEKMQLHEIIQGPDVVH